MLWVHWRVTCAIHFLCSSKGDIENAIKFLELFVEIAENAVSQTHLDIEEADKSGPQGPDEMASKQGQLARACSAIGAMCTSVV